jgi:hypothetical protein
MRQITKLLSMSLIPFVFIGCGGATVKPPAERTPLPIAKKEKANVVSLEGRIAYDNTTALQAAALELREAAKLLKAQGYEYFTLSSRYANPMTTKFSDFVAYCFPDNAGPDSKDYGKKSTGLENGKCKIPEITFKEGSSKGYRVVAYGFKEPKLDTATWSVEQVLTDPVIDEYIKAGYADAQILPKNEVITFESRSKLPLY